jgi:NADP-dependent 3-hydroxy acid dehydrogenase YdfG
MVTLKDVRTSNEQLKNSDVPIVALFIGATSGIGKGTLLQLARHVPVLKVYIVGRSQRAAAAQLEQLTSVNPDGEFIFMETEISLIGNVDRICEEIKLKEDKLDILYLSPGCPLWGGIQGPLPNTKRYLR